MRTRSLSFVLGASLLTGLAMAQAPATQSQPDVGIAPQSAQSEQQTGQQPASPNEPRGTVDPARAALRLGRQLGLTQDQVAQIQPILADRQQQIESIRTDPSLMPRDRRRKMRNAMLDSRNKIEALLTDQQKQQFEQIMADRRGNRGRPQAQ